MSGIGAWLLGKGIKLRVPMGATRLPVEKESQGAAQALLQLVDARQAVAGSFDFRRMTTPPGVRVMIAYEKTWRSEILPGYGRFLDARTLHLSDELGLPIEQTRLLLQEELFAEEPPMMRVTDQYHRDAERGWEVDTDSLPTINDMEIFD